MQFIALLLYMGVLEMPWLHLYWSTSKLFSGLLPTNIKWRQHFKALLAMLHISHPETNNGATAQKLDKVSWLLQYINNCSASLFQPYREISVDERMVKSKARSGIRQYIRDKVVKWGYKLWFLADLKTGCTIQFIVYTGKREKHSAYGLAFDVVTKFCVKYLDRGYIIYMDNFYTSTSLLLHLLERKTLACGTTRKDHRGFPTELKGITGEKRAKRGDIRWLRDKVSLMARSTCCAYG